MTMLHIPKKDFGVEKPYYSHYRRATCRDVFCDPHVYGWRTVLSQKAQGDLIDWVRGESGREFTEVRQGDIVEFVFRPGQECFESSKHGRIAVRDDAFLSIDNRRTDDDEFIYTLQEATYRGIQEV